MKSILVVDDHPVNRMLAVALIRKLGYHPLEAADGEDALAIVLDQRPALVISDILMPVVDGFELVRRLRANPAIAHTKVILWSATYREQEAAELARVGGVFRVLSKPCAPAEVLRAIEHALADEVPMAGSIDAGFDRAHLRLMTDKLSAHEGALRRAQRVARVAHLVTRPDGSFESWSEMLPEITGFDDASMPRSARAWLQFVSPEHRSVFRAKAVAAARYGLRTELEYSMLRPDGAWVILSHVIEPVHAGMQSQDEARWFSTLQDITVQRRAADEVRRLNADLERNVRERTAELQTALTELESFDYSISHDLRAPINRIRGFVGAFLEDHAAGVDEEGLDLLRRVAEAGERMEQLVGDLFSLSTISRGGLEPVPVDISALARDVVTTLRRAHPGRNVVTEVEPALTARADPGLLRIVLENLLGNAWKFTGRKEDGRVEVGCELPAPDRPVFFVRDNGAGFNPDHAGKLFAPFQRLHARSDFEGTGIGLATVSRIVSRHGGRIWAEGREGAGATIRFTLWESP